MSDSVRPHRQQPTSFPHPWDSPGKNTGVGCHFLLQCMKVKSESEVAQSCLTLCGPMDCSTPGLPVHHQLPEFTQSHSHWVGDAIQPSHPLSSCSSPALNLSQHQGLFQWASSSHQVAKVWNFSFSISPFSEYSGLISFRRDWFDLLAAQGALKSFLQCYSSKASILWYSAFFMVQLSHPYVITGKTIALSIWLLSGSPQIFTLSTYFSLAITFGRSWKGAWRKQLILKFNIKLNWGKLKIKQVDIHQLFSVKWFFPSCLIYNFVQPMKHSCNLLISHSLAFTYLSPSRI